MNILIFFVKSLFFVLALPFKMVGWFAWKLRGEPGSEEAVDDKDESYDFDDAQAPAQEGLDYNIQGYENHEIGNERGWKPLQANLQMEDDEPELAKGNVILDHHALFVRHEGRQVLVVDYELPDIPSWLEYQKDIGHFSIVMLGGAVAHIDLAVDHDYIADLQQESRILLVTSGENEKIVHHLMFMVK